MSDSESDNILPDLIELDPMDTQDFSEEEELSDCNIEDNSGDSDIGETTSNCDYSHQGSGDSVNGDESNSDERDAGNGGRSNGIDSGEGDGDNSNGPGKAAVLSSGIQRPIPQPPRRQRAYVLIPPRLKARTRNKPVAPPANGVPVDLPGRDPDLPQFFELKSHPLAPDGHSGRIFLAYVNYSNESLTKLFSKAANMAPPTSRTEIKDRGEIPLVPYCTNNSDLI